MVSGQVQNPFTVPRHRTMTMGGRFSEEGLIPIAPMEEKNMREEEALIGCCADSAKCLFEINLNFVYRTFLHLHQYQHACYSCSSLITYYLYYSQVKLTPILHLTG